MEFKKPVIKVGGESLGIRFNTQELKTHNIKLGDEIDLSDAVVLKKEGEN